MDQRTSGLTSSVQVLTLSKGLYLVTVKSASPRLVGDEVEFALPAIHIGGVPGAPPGQVEIISGPREHGPWLYDKHDMMILKVAGGPASVLLTSLRTANAATIEVDVRRLDARTLPAERAPPPRPPVASNGTEAPVTAPQSPASALAENPGPPTAASPTPQHRNNGADRKALRTKILLHIQKKGDVSYVDNFWAGALGERLAIEAFAVTPVERLDPTQIEYKALTEDGVETAWTSGGALCGKRGQGKALAGFAVRIKKAWAPTYECEYRGSFSSGKIVGPLRNGGPCRSDPGDRLEAIQVFVLERGAAIEEGAPVLDSVQEVEADPPRPIGPRFSVFRENPE